MILVDGYNGGVAHITADQIRDHNIAMYGDGDYVLPVGDKFAYEIVNNNTINLSSGMVVMNGARAVTGYGKTETLTIENGTSGYKRVDIIVAEYSKDNETLVESVTVKVVKGTLGSAYSDPALVTGDIRAGATKRQMALYRVKVNGLSIEAVEKMWTAAAATLGANIVPIVQGGTGATTATGAWGNLVNEYNKDGWHIKEYANGYCELHYKQSMTVSGSGWNAWGSAYVKDVGAVSYPVTFAEIPYQSVELQTDQNSGWISVGSNTISTTGHHQMLRPSAGTAFKGAILYTVYGKLA